MDRLDIPSMTLSSLLIDSISDAFDEDACRYALLLIPQNSFLVGWFPENMNIGIWKLM